MLEKDEQRIIGLIERAMNREEAVTIVPASVAAAAAHYARRGEVTLLTSDGKHMPRLLAALNATSVEIVYT